MVASGLNRITTDLLLRHAGSVVVVSGLNCFVACGILVTQPGVKPTYPALQGGFLTPEPPGKSLEREFKITMIDMLRNLLEKGYSMKEYVGNVNREVETLRNN